MFFFSFVLQVYQDLQVHQEFQLQVVVVTLDRLASQEREVRRESLAFQECLCRVPQVVRDLPVSRDHQVLLDLQALPQHNQTVSPESLGVLVCREREVTQERRAKKVRDEIKFYCPACSPPSRKC